MTPRRTSLFLGICLVSAFLVAGCDGDTPPPAAPTPPVTTPPPTPTPTPTPTPPPAPAELDSLVLTPSTIRSQGRPVATVTLTAAAPEGGAIVTLLSNNTDVAKVPSGMTVQAGSTTGTFTIDTTTVAVTSPVTLEARYKDVTKTAVLTVTPPPLEPRFTVTSVSRGADACAISDVFGSVDCTLDASTSDGFAARYIWTIKVGSNTLVLAQNSAAFVASTTCASLSGGTVESNGTVTMTIQLQLEDRQGNQSGVQSKNLPLYPNGRCGY